ncbi:MAG: TolC family protein [Gemmatimonadaceae bacterium]
MTMHSAWRATRLALLAAVAPWLSAHAQSLTLSQALDRADRGAYAVRAARGNANAQQAPAIAALRGVLPSVRIDAGLFRTTDPIGAFGNSLRQRTISPADFDPQRLNFPPVSQNWMGAMVIEQPLMNLDAWTGRSAARHAARATTASVNWTTSETRVDVVRAFYGAILASTKVATLIVANQAAAAHVRQAELMAKNGIVTPSDALLASVKAGEVESLLLEAHGDATTAKLGLATALGTPEDTAFTLAPALPAAGAIRQVADEALHAAPETRADVAAAREASSAAGADAWRARALYLPRLNSFARYDWNSTAHAFGGQKNWTVGVMASWAPFTGASELAERRATSGRLESAAAMRDAAEARAQLEVEQSAIALNVALSRLTIAERAVRQSTDAHRIVARKYEGGLASVVELLDAAALETQSRLGLDGARYNAVVATAQRLKALGRDPGQLRMLDQLTPVTTDENQ